MSQPSESSDGSSAGLQSGFLSNRALEGLKHYKYKAGGYTALDDAHQPLWEALVSLLPMWLAPNLITTIASACIFIAYALNLYFDLQMQGQAPSWVYWLTALSVVLYVNLDCMDGKQARRTGSSSPLGQLFDHGCDALVLHMMLANIASSLGLACSWKMAAGCLGVMLPWMLAQWEEYHTGTMIYGTQYFGVLEANYAICLVHVITAVWGVALWQLPLHTLLPLPSPAAADSSAAPAAGATQLLQQLGSCTVADAALLAVSAAGVFQGAKNIARVFGGKEILPKEEQGHKELGRAAAAKHLALLLLVLLLGAWTVADASTISDTTASDSAAADSAKAGSGATATGITVNATSNSPSDGMACRVTYSTFGVLYAFVACNVIIAHMAKEPMPAPTLPLISFAAVVANNLGLHVLPPWRLAQLMHGLALLVHGLYCSGVVAQICAHLGLSCFTIRKVACSKAKCS